MYGFTSTLTGVTFDESIAKTTAALKAEGRGILGFDGGRTQRPFTNDLLWPAV